MKIRQNSVKNQTLAVLIGSALMAGFAANLQADAVVVTDITDWGTTPMEIVNVSDPYLNYYSGVYAGINTLSIQDGDTTYVRNGFCIDPFHWSLTGPISGYSTEPLVDGPKAPGTLNAPTARDIEILWTEFYSPTMSSQSAAGLQIAIWDLVSSNAVATGELPPSEAFSVTSYDYGASADLATLVGYDGPVDTLTALSGPGQDYVVDSVPDGGQTLILLALAAGAMILVRNIVIERRQVQPVRVRVVRR